VLKYYGDPSEIPNNPLGKGALKKDAWPFNGDNANASLVIATTSRTMARRYGPKALHYWRMSKGMKLREADNNWKINDAKWPHCLKGCFSLCIIDEAQVVKNPNSAAHIAMM
jgi:hypothetical protein